MNEKLLFFLIFVFGLIWIINAFRDLKYNYLNKLITRVIPKPKFSEWFTLYSIHV